MDQVRKVLSWLKQQHFWVLSVLIVLIGLFSWWRAAGAMKKQYTDSESKISAGFQTVESVQNDPFHPNDEIRKQQTKEYNLLLDEVTKLWQDLYNRQRENVLTWPSGPTELKPQFVETVEKLQFGDEIEDSLREHYQNYIFNHFPKLPEKVGARAILEGQAGATGGAGFSRIGREMSPEGGPGGMTTGGELEDDGNYLCEWLEADQAAVRAELEFPQTPSSLRIWCTQENLWVYHTLLDVIKNTNSAANATRISNAAVRGIYSLQVGQTAAPFSRQPGRIYKVPTAAAPGGGPESEMPGAAPAGPEGAPVSEFGPSPGGGEFARSGLALGMTGELTEGQERAQLLHGRYLGEDGKPIPFGGGGAVGGDGTEVVDTGPAGPLDVSMFGKEYKRLPIRMVLEMDQRHLPKLITECAIRPLQIEVQEVRINAPDLMSGAGGGGMSGRMSFAEGAGMGVGNLMPDLTGLQQFNPQPQIATVGIQGVIYIFNKPDMELLKPTTDDTAVAQAQ